MPLAFAAKTLYFAVCFPLSSWLRHCPSRVFSLACAADTPPWPRGPHQASTSSSRAGSLKLMRAPRHPRLRTLQLRRHALQLQPLKSTLDTPGRLHHDRHHALQLHQTVYSCAVAPYSFAVASYYCIAQASQPGYVLSGRTKQLALLCSLSYSLGSPMFRHVRLNLDSVSFIPSFHACALILPLIVFLSLPASLLSPYLIS